MIGIIKAKEIEPGMIIKLHDSALAEYEVVYTRPVRRRYRDMGGDWVYPVRLKAHNRHAVEEYTALIGSKERVVCLREAGE